MTDRDTLARLIFPKAFTSRIDMRQMAYDAADRVLAAGWQNTRRESEQRRDAFRVKTKCNCCGYQSMGIYPEDHAMCPLTHCFGAMVDFTNSS